MALINASLRIRSVGFAVALALTACGSARPATVPSGALAGTDHASHVLRVPNATATVLVFFSSHCPCVNAHDARLVALARAYEPKGVRVFAIDSEVEATAARDEGEAGARGYPFPILIDPGGKVAAALGAEYATYTVVLDAAGNVRYRGAFDDQRTDLHAGEVAYVRDAIDDVLAGRAVRRTGIDALGCALRTW